MTFRTLVIDPPWPYAPATTHKKLTGYIAGDNEKYSTMSVGDIQAMNIQSILAPQGYVFLWTTGAFMKSAIAVIEAWGLQYRTMLFWVKTTASGKTAYGNGYWVRSSVEPIILATSPGTPAIRTNERASFEAMRGEHSAKPEVFQDFVERHFPGPYGELFARRHRPGWTCLGGELSGLDINEEMKAYTGA